MASTRSKEKVEAQLTIQSHSGPYPVYFKVDGFEGLGSSNADQQYFVVDKRVAELYNDRLTDLLAQPSTLLIEASERAKSLDQFTDYVEHLVRFGIRRGNKLVAIGGGVVQDIVCFLAAVLMRGIDWHFYPTTLLAQADSCIGSKSSVNVGKVKNILGTFTPPQEIVIDISVLETLAEIDLRSGIGEMLKVHAIDGPDSFNEIASDYSEIVVGSEVMTRYIYRSLDIKKGVIEEDEFDRGRRNVMNYGHSFGHAIEAATDFAVPHGIAITVGVDMANYVAWQLDVSTEQHYRRMKPTLALNYAGISEVAIPADRVLDAISKDKKNTDKVLRLVLPDRSGKISVDSYELNDRFKAICSEYLNRELGE